MTTDRQGPSDEELDRLLRAHLRRTSPEFELRWRELRRTFVTPAPARAWRWPRWVLWPGLAAATVAVVALMFDLRRSRVQPAPPDAFASLVALDAALAPAQPLLEPETRDAVLHLPITP